jgi:ADP-ribose pyrophosphatase
MKKIGVSQKAIIFNREGKILVLRRSGTALSNPGKWDFPGGDLEFGEDAIGGIIREIREETGLEVKN